KKESGWATSQGQCWASYSNTPFRKFKKFVHEGGIATPLIIHWPAGLAAEGELRTAVGHVVDVAPTLVELAGGVWRDEVEQTPLPDSPGRSLASTFGEDVALSRESLWWLHEGNRALRQGDWKIVAAKDDPWELYDLTLDRAETENLAVRQPDRLREMERRWLEITRQTQQIATLEGRAAP
ncbi:MAG: arylsulfatase, partial [Planctomycetota bacterium]